MGILFAFVAALFAGISNFCMRRSIDAGGSSKAFLVVQLSFAFIAMILLNPVRTGTYGWNAEVIFLGLLGGILLGILMWGVGRTLENGPPGLSFAVLNTSSVMPGVILALMFGSVFGHNYTVWNGMGSLLVVLGLFWAGWTSSYNPNKLIWAMFAMLIFCIHTVFLVFLQWWAMLINTKMPTSPWLPFHIDPINIQWFMPAILFVGAFIQWGIYWRAKQPFPKKKVIVYGLFGGIGNGACTFFLILAPQVCKAWENPMIFPIFSVSIVLICNVWAQRLYKEKVNWMANFVCLGGLLIGTLFS